jgi:hypothetical protein
VEPQKARNPAADGSARRVHGIDLAGELKCPEAIITTNIATQVTVEPFDYGRLNPDVVSRLREQADLIKAKITKTTADIIDIGQHLAAAKKHTEHGQFVRWVEAEIGIEARSAQRFMAAARLHDKNDTVSLLPPATVYRLAAKSTSPAVVDAVITKAVAGEIMPDAIVKRMISDAKQEHALQKGAKRRRQKIKRWLEEQERQQLEAKQGRRLELERAAAWAALLIERYGVACGRLVLEMLAENLFDAFDALTARIAEIEHAEMELVEIVRAGTEPAGKEIEP